MENSRLEIRRFHGRYLVSRDHPAPERVKAWLDEAVAGGLAAMLSSILSRCFSDADTSVWQIRQLEIDLDVNAAWERDSLTRAWAQQVGLTLYRVLQDGADGENVRWFPNRAAYLARFLADAAAGCAWNQWYYESFAGFRQLPMSAALRTAICEDPAIGLAALHQLCLDELTRVLSTLTSQDARRSLDSIAAAAPTAEELPCLEAARIAWEAAGWGPYETNEESRTALRLYIAASRDRTDVGGPHLRVAALALTRVPFLPTTHHASDQADSPAGPRHTTFGGIFLLLPLLDELPLAEATNDWPEADGMAAVALVRFLLLVKCCGQSRAHNALYDPALRDLMGIAPAVSASVVAAWQKRISAANRHVFLQTLATWHRSRGAITREHQILTCVNPRGTPVALLIDGARGLWVHACGFQPRRPDRVHRALRSWFSPGERKEALILSDPDLFAELCAAFPDQRIVSLRDDAAKSDGQVAEILTRLNKLADDLSYLSSPESFGIGRSLDLTLSVAAQGLMRAFSWRLPGFAGSNLPYLYSNFLKCSAAMEEEAERRVVWLSRPPLYLVLNMTGACNKTYRLSWLDDRPLALFPES